MGLAQVVPFWGLWLPSQFYNRCFSTRNFPGSTGESCCYIASWDAGDSRRGQGQGQCHTSRDGLHRAPKNVFQDEVAHFISVGGAGCIFPPHFPEALRGQESASEIQSSRERQDGGPHSTDGLSEAPQPRREEPTDRSPVGEDLQVSTEKCCAVHITRAAF